MLANILSMVNIFVWLVFVGGIVYYFDGFSWLCIFGMIVGAGLGLFVCNMLYSYGRSEQQRLYRLHGR